MRIALYLLQMLTHFVLTTSRRVTAIDVNICCTQVNVTHMRAAGYLVLFSSNMVFTLSPTQLLRQYKRIQFAFPERQDYLYF